MGDGPLRNRTVSFVDDRRGAAAAEFALVVPLLFTMLLGIVQFGIALNRNLLLTDGVRAGTRLLAIGRSSSTVYSDATNRLYGASSLPSTGFRSLKLYVNGAECTDDGSCKTLFAPTNISGKEATIAASIGCNLVVMGIDFAPNCSLSSHSTERIE